MPLESPKNVNASNNPSSISKSLHYENDTGTPKSLLCGTTPVAAGSVIERSTLNLLP
jgi:hypothetical protein